MHIRLVSIAIALAPSNAFLVPIPRSTRISPNTSPHHPSTTLYIFGDADDSPIPPELRDEIYAAEARTPTAQTRPQRILTYGALTFLGITIAFFNAFLTSLRYGDGAPSTELSYYGFGWVESNFLTSFFLMNKIGGGLGLLSAGLFGTLAEVEVRSKKENAEKIWEEMQRRQAAREVGSAKKSKKKNVLPPPSKKSMTGKQKKRLSALQELMEEEKNEMISGPTESDEEAQSAEIQQSQPTEEKKEEKGIFTTIKNFYDKADSMAASQALLLNKELEDRGVIEKITDESGLKVIGREAAAAAKENAESEKNKEGSS